MVNRTVVPVTPENQQQLADRALLLSGGGNDGTGTSMDARVTRLETHMEYVRADLSEIKAGQKATEAALASLASAAEKLSSKIDISELKISNQIKDLPTKSDLKNYNLQLIGIGIAILILVVTGIAGGLVFVKHN